MAKQKKWLKESLVSILTSIGLLAGTSWFYPARSVTFEAPNDASPRRSTGGASRGTIKFLPPAAAYPNVERGDVTRGETVFETNGANAPTRTTGGASRGETVFETNGADAPAQTTGGASRGEVTFETPGRESPNTTSGASSRGEQYFVTALIPNTNHGRTVSERPTFYIYMPATSVKQVFFSLQDEDRNSYYQTTLPIANRKGIISFTLPDEAPPLEVGKHYEWYFVTLEGDRLRPDSPSISGWIERIEPDRSLAAQASAGTSLELAASYGRQGVWYDTLTTLVELKRSEPDNNNLVSEWTELLEQVGLGDYAANPILVTEPLTE
ncbi:DUF928 domain-containing protein [Oscillatoriales cyanobacterium LEGE 11467]|uniref:DUF928 domain-containing protein n=1 Tax=Zarconia navalis LEGE 11467 TaxID=1828826 RepID=A0A928VV12_9CYAN|nr:DUF928 domain-containing protein [Zarconia navalis]MBE9040752.1 DUF928 domain-containing protein [Zarconia navalis LEGE 11467]